MNFTIARIRGDQWRLLKETRLRALEDAPHAFCTTLAEGRKITDNDWQAMARDHATLSDRAFFMAYVDGMPCGMGRCHHTAPHTVELAEMWVAPEVRGRNMGEGIVRAVVQWAEGAATLEAWVREDNPARTFYQRLGFRETAATEPLCSNPGVSIILIALDLTYRQAEDRCFGPDGTKDHRTTTPP